MDQEKIIRAIADKYLNINENPTTYLKGLLETKPLTYWDYVEADTLLTLQKPKTDYKDEESFIIYNQITELILKMMLNEIKQITEENNLTEKVLIQKLSRLICYTQMLISFFDSMKIGIDYQDYNSFRLALAPASGFQSAQFRFLELHCTSLENLINEEGKKRLSVNPGIEECFEHIYWRDGGINRQTGEKTYTLKKFEEKYMESFISLAKKIKGNTLEDKICRLQNPSDELLTQFKEFDRLYNIEWPLVHLDVAHYYLNNKGENKASTGGSEWKKYLHPQSQQRKFFPGLWTEAEKTNWGRPQPKNQTA